MRGKWLDASASAEYLHDEDSSDAQGQPSTSGRHHGHRWFSVMQGIRRSLDVHLKSYYKIDSAFTSTLRFTTASDKLKALTRAVTETGLVDFCCVYLVHPARGTFGVAALSGAGAELYPPRLADEDAQQAIRMNDTGSQSFLNVFTRCVFQVNDSNWCVEDVVASKAPWYYDCASAANGFGLPQDGGWLRRGGMRSMLALPCMQGDDVTGVVAVASKHKSLDHLLLRKLEELCFKITPTVTDAVLHFSPLLCNTRMAAPYESITDFAHEVLGEMLNLDRAVAASVSAINRTTANISVSHHQQQQQPCAGRGRKAAEERSMFDATAAVAAAAAAGFSWTVPASAPASAPSASAGAAAPLAQIRLRGGGDRQHERPSAQSLLGVGGETFCTALADDVASYSVVLTSDLASASALPHLELASMISLDDLMASERLTPAAASAPLEPLEPFDCDAVEAADAAQPTRGSLPHGGWIRAQHVDTSRSLPERKPVAMSGGGGGGGAAVDFLRGCAAGGAASLSPQQLHHHRQQPAAASRVASASADRKASRSTRSLSCLEFSGGGVADNAREELANNYDNNSGNGSGIMSPAAAATAAAAAANPASGSPLCPTAANAPRFLRAPLRQQQQRRCPVARQGAADGTPCSSKRSTESGAGEGYMIESHSTEELTAALRNVVGGGGSVTATTTTSPSVWNSLKNMESRIMQRGAPLEASVGAAGGVPSSVPAAPAAAAAPPPLAAARGSSCATDYSAATTFDTATTFAYANGSHHNACSMYGSFGCMAAAAGDMAEVRTSLRGVARGRWSRDSAAAAAAVWSNEAAEAVAAAMSFTAQLQDDEQRASSSIWTAAAAAAAPPSGQRSDGRGIHGCAGAPKAAAFGGLYGIRESGPVPSSIEFSDSDDGSVALVDVDVSSCSPGGGGFVLSSGLGAEAQHRQQRERRGSSSCCHVGSGSGAAQPPQSPLLADGAAS
ncbi:hypothetical protein PLESTB_000632100 [Pleodorina starrii]|uniref:GAF domain-containing protein n=1 Tax=Pleodorina starrii TaxID=330485 RepID=A0A9W6BHT4_9CHLO|nr:hypothetical protein PLESTB_000632100 [Pleodorina starrii]GLC69713.1 hypothetical protein PLESTF_000869200 [Pleodorina starrii]